MLRYKIDVLWELKVRGYSTYRLRKEKLLGENVITMLRNKDIIGARVLDRLCRLLQMQPGDILEYIEAPIEPTVDTFEEEE